MKLLTFFWMSIFSFSCGSLIFDVVFRFRTEVAEDEIISTIQTAIVDGKLGNLNVNVLPFTGIPPVEQTSTAAPTSATPKSGGLFLSCYYVTESDTISVIEFVIFACLSLLSFQSLRRNNTTDSYKNEFEQVLYSSFYSM